MVRFYMLLLATGMCVHAQTVQRGLEIYADNVRQGEPVTVYSNSYALVVGINDYRHWAQLDNAEVDAKRVARALRENGFEVTLLTDISKDEFDTAFYEFLARYANHPHNRILFYFAGHGATQEIQGRTRGSIAFVDTPQPPGMSYQLKSVSMERLYRDSLRMKAHHVLFMFDSCFSGSVLRFRSLADAPVHIQDHVRHPVRQFITAGSADEPVPDQSVFAQTFISLLEGHRPDLNNDGYLSGRELGQLIWTDVTGTVSNQHPQSAVMNDPRFNKGDFVFKIPVRKEAQ